MDNNARKETDRLKKEFKKANQEADACMLKKCKHIKNLKNISVKIKKCNKEVKDYPPNKILDKMKTLNKCYAKNKITNDTMFKIGECVANKCKDNVAKIQSITSDLVYVTHPNGKELKELKTKFNELLEQEKLCKEQKCGHIYPFDKLKAENAECDKFLFEKNDKYSKCVEKYKIYEHNSAISKCKKSKCKKIVTELDQIRDRMFTLQNNNSSLKQMKKNILTKKKSTSRK
jgi:hypothetical protein